MFNVADGDALRDFYVILHDIERSHVDPHHALPLAFVSHDMGSLAYIVAKDWGGYRQEQGLITAGLERMQGRMDYYALYNV